MDLVQRLVEPIAREYLGAFRIVVLNGPRQSGKSTLMRAMAGTRGQIRNLDDPTELAAAHNDPVGFVSANARPLFIDEVQRGGEPLIRAVKAEVDRDPQAGKFVLAGSTRFLSEPTLGESLAGRSAFLEVLPLSEGELRGQGKIFLDLAFEAPESLRDLVPAHTRTTRLRQAVGTWRLPRTSLDGRAAYAERVVRKLCPSNHRA